MNEQKNFKFVSSYNTVVSFLLNNHPDIISKPCEKPIVLFSQNDTVNLIQLSKLKQQIMEKHKIIFKAEQSKRNTDICCLIVNIVSNVLGYPV